MVTLQLSEGNHTIKWTYNGYAALEADITISSTGQITCTGVRSDGVSVSCSSASPGISISGSTITGTLQVLQSTICSWITGQGGWRNIMAFDIMTLKAAYSGAIDVGFKVSAAHIMASKAYYSEKINGTPESGNGLSGCAFT